MYVCYRVALSCLCVCMYISLCMSRSKKCKLDTFSSGSSDGCVGPRQPHCEQDGCEGGSREKEGRREPNREGGNELESRVLQECST
jgi:hypothetical protein